MFIRTLWKRSGLGGKIFFLFSISLLLIVLMSVGIIFSFNRVSRATDAYTQSRNEVESLVAWERGNYQLRDAISGYLATWDPALVEEVAALQKQSREALDEALAVIGDEARRDMVGELATAQQATVTAFEKQVSIRQKSQTLQEESLAPLRRDMDERIGNLIDDSRMMGAIAEALSLTELRMNLLSARSHTQNFQMTGHASDAEAAAKVMEGLIQNFEQLLVDYHEMAEFDPSLVNEKKEADINQLIADAKTYHAALARLVAYQDELARVTAEDMADALVELQVTMEKLLVNLADWESEVAGGLISLVDVSRNLSIAASIAGILFCLFAGYFLSQWIKKNLKSVADQLRVAARETDSASVQIASSSQELATGANEQAASLEETSAAMEEMAGMVDRSTDNAVRAKDLSKVAREAANGGVRDMEAMAASMNTIIQSSKEISKIIKTIDEIAFQTNILALNAAVEAARAGEAGAGFAVVAEEVRNLAQRSAAAAKETAERLGAAAEQTEHGANMSRKAGESLQHIVARVQEVDGLVEEIAASSMEQSQGIKQINSAVMQMDRVTQSNAAGAEETAAAGASLRDQSIGLKEAVTSLIALVDGESSALRDEESDSSRDEGAGEREAPHASGKRADGHAADLEKQASKESPAAKKPGPNVGAKERDGDDGSRTQKVASISSNGSDGGSVEDFFR